MYKKIFSGLKKINLIVLVFTLILDMGFISLAQAAISGDLNDGGDGSDHGLEEVISNDKTVRYSRSADSIYDSITYQSEILLPRLDEINPFYINSLTTKIQEYGNLVTDFRNSGDLDDDESFYTILRGYKLYRKVTNNFSNINKVAKNIETLYLLANTMQSYLTENNLGESIYYTNLNDNFDDIDNLTSSLNTLMEEVYSTVNQSDEENYTLYVKVIDQKKIELDSLVNIYSDLADSLITESGMALDYMKNTDEDSIAECEENNGEWIDGECFCPKGVWDDENKQCVSERQLAEECEKGGGKWTGEECFCPKGVWDDENKQCVSERQLAEECEKGGGKWTGEECFCPKGVWDDENKQCVSEKQLAEECEKGGGKWIDGECFCKKGEWNSIDKICEVKN